MSEQGHGTDHDEETSLLVSVAAARRRRAALERRLHTAHEWLPIASARCKDFQPAEMLKDLEARLAEARLAEGKQVASLPRRPPPGYPLGLGGPRLQIDQSASVLAPGHATAGIGIGDPPPASLEGVAGAPVDVYTHFREYPAAGWGVDNDFRYRPYRRPTTDELLNGAGWVPAEAEAQAEGCAFGVSLASSLGDGFHPPVDAMEVLVVFRYALPVLGHDAVAMWTGELAVSVGCVDVWGGGEGCLSLAPVVLHTAPNTYMGGYLYYPAVVWGDSSAAMRQQDWKLGGTLVVPAGSASFVSVGLSITVSAQDFPFEFGKGYVNDAQRGRVHTGATPHLDWDDLWPEAHFVIRYARGLVSPAISPGAEPYAPGLRYSMHRL